MSRIESLTDLRNWVANGWPERDNDDHEKIAQWLQSGDHPGYGRDWSDYFVSMLGEGNAQHALIAEVCGDADCS